MRYDSQRIYLMDFDRQSTEIFDGQSFRFSDKEILLGVDSPERVQAKYSDNRTFYAFSKGNALYRLNSEGMLTRIFSYLTEENDSLPRRLSLSRHSTHGCKNERRCRLYGLRLHQQRNDMKDIRASFSTPMTIGKYCSREFLSSFEGK